MLCRLALRRNIHQGEDQTEYVLRVAAEHTLGSAGMLGSDEKIFSSEQELVRCLRALGVSEKTISKAEDATRQPASAVRFIGFAENEQLAFSRIQDAEFDLFDE